MTHPTPDQFRDQMAAVDSEGTYAGIMEQNARLTSQRVLDTVQAMRGAPLDPGAAVPPTWQPATTLARWAQDPVTPEAVSMTLIRIGAKLGVQIRPEAECTLSELDLYVDGRLAAELVLPRPGPVGSGSGPGAIPFAGPETGIWTDVILPDDAAERPVIVELCKVNRVLAQASAAPDLNTAKPKINGGFSGIRKGALTIWAVDRSAPQRPVPVNLRWSGTSHTVLLDRPPGSDSSQMPVVALPLNALPDDQHVDVRLMANDRQLRRGAFNLQRKGDWFLVSRCIRGADGVLWATVLPYHIDSPEPRKPAQVRPEIIPAEDGKPLWKGKECTADHPDSPEFSFLSGHFSLRLGLQAADKAPPQPNSDSSAGHTKDAISDPGQGAPPKTPGAQTSAADPSEADIPKISVPGDALHAAGAVLRLRVRCDDGAEACINFGPIESLASNAAPEDVPETPQ